MVDAERRLLGVVRRGDLRRLQSRHGAEAGCPLAAAVRQEPVVAHPDEPLRVVAYRMAETGFTRFPVVERGEGRRLVGMVALRDLLEARVRNLEAERRRERVIPLRPVFPWSARRRAG